MAPATIRMVLVEGENADGLTVDEDYFDVGDANDPRTLSAPDQVIAAIFGTPVIPVLKESNSTVYWGRPKS
jgi:hypothetical protein